MWNFGRITFQERELQLQGSWSRNLSGISEEQQIASEGKAEKLRENRR